MLHLNGYNIANPAILARPPAVVERPRRQMLVLRTPKGWTGPAEVDGVAVEGTSY